MFSMAFPGLLRKSTTVPWMSSVRLLLAWSWGQNALRLTPEGWAKGRAEVLAKAFRAQHSLHGWCAHKRVLGVMNTRRKWEHWHGRLALSERRMARSFNGLFHFIALWNRAVLHMRNDHCGSWMRVVGRYVVPSVLRNVWTLLCRKALSEQKMLCIS